jgi:glyoxylase-like metal-dependent hydrolase (beta-lactamase superfamily II)
MIFRHFLLDVNESNAFIVGCEDTREALLVDAGDYDAGISGFLDQERLKLTKIFITHDHYDHTGGLGEFTRRYKAEVLAGASNAGGQRATRVRAADTVRVGNLTGKVLETPGHTQDSVSLAFPGHVFTGDALFAGSVGGTSSQSAARQLLDAIQTQIFSLPLDTEIHTGHGPSSTVAIESEHNPFFV